jgi:hypothetical protein
LSGVAGSRSTSDRREASDPGHELDRAGEHPADDRPVDGAVPSDQLARGPDQELAGGARLHVERDRFRAHRVGALQISHLDDLVAAEARMAIGDDEMSLAGNDRKARGELRRPGAGGVDDDSGPPRSLRRLDRFRSEAAHGHPLANHGSARYGAGEKRPGGGRRVKDGIAGHAQSSAEPRAEVRLERRQIRRFDDLRVDVPG